MPMVPHPVSVDGAQEIVEGGPVLAADAEFALGFLGMGEHEEVPWDARLIGGELTPRGQGRSLGLGKNTRGHEGEHRKDPSEALHDVPTVGLAGRALNPQDK
jgi:hypothetical protein